MEQSTGIVFISGTGLNSFLWEDLKKRMKHPVLIIDFPNDNKRGEFNSKQSLENYVKETVNAIKNWNVNNFIIVAHSVGGIVALKLVKEFTGEMKGFVAINCVIPKNGQSYFSALPVPQRMLHGLLLRFSKVGYVQRRMMTQIFGDLPQKAALVVIRAYTKENKKHYRTTIKYKFPSMDRLYIKLINDKLMPSNVQDAMIENFKATKIDTLEGGHFPMLSNTERLASILNDFIYNTENVQN